MPLLCVFEENVNASYRWNTCILCNNPLIRPEQDDGYIVDDKYMSLIKHIYGERITKNNKAGTIIAYHSYITYAIASQITGNADIFKQAYNNENITSPAL